MSTFSRRAFVTSSLAAGLAVTAGCSSSSSSSPDPGSPMDMTFTTWVGDAAIHEIWQTLAEEFRADNPELGTLTIQVIPFEEQISRVSTLLQGGDAPDLSMIPMELVSSWNHAGALYDLSALKEDPEWGWEDMSPNLVAPYEGDDGELWAYPMVNTVHPIFYNKSAYEAAGVETPGELYARNEWNWNSLRESARAMVDSGEVPFGFDSPGWSFTGVPGFIARATNANYFPEDGSCALTEESSVASINFLREMMWEDGSYKTPGTSPNFPSGDTAMAINPPSYQGQLLETDFEWDMVPQPGGDGEYNPNLAQATIGVWAKGKAPEFATRLLAYLTGPRGAEAQAGTYISARTTDLANTEEVMKEIYPETDPESISSSVFEPLAFATPLPSPVRQSEVDSAINPILDGLWVEDADVEDVLAQACEVASPLLI